MQNYFRLAWRNLWRNKRRTFITLASVFLAVLLAICMRSMQLGTYANMIGNAVRFSTGYIQIHQQGYWDKPSVNNSFEQNDTLDQLIATNKNIALAVPRLESFVLASSGDHTKGVQVTGIDPELENKMNGIAGKISAGSYFNTNDDDAVLIGDGIASYLKLGIGDTLVLLGQGYQGTTAAGQFRVTGIYHFPDNRMNNSSVYLTLTGAQNLFAAYGRLTSVSLMLRQPRKIDQTQKALAAKLNANVWEVMEWQTMNKTLLEEITGDNAGGLIMLGILYIVIAFGVFGTILMMTMERKKEFAVMIAIGMKRFQLILMLLVETCFIGFLGILAGLVISLPVLIYFNIYPVRITGTAAEMFEQFGIEPIMPASLDPYIFINQGIVVLVIALVAAIYPLIYIKRFKILDALKQ